jgi:hypothetical protein
MYRVKVIGQYVARSPVSDKEKIKKNYEIEGNIPTLTAALSIVKNKLLAPALSRKYPDYVTFLTYHIIEITPLTDKAKSDMSKAEVQFMDRPTLLRHIKDDALQIGDDDKNAPVEPFPHAYFPDTLKLREAVQMCKEDPIGFTKWFRARKEDLAMDIEMARANPELFNQPATTPDLIASVSLSRKTEADPERAEALRTQVKASTDARLNGLAHDMRRDNELGDMDTHSDAEGL